MRYGDLYRVIELSPAALDIVKRAISMGGTCTGEHGIGIGKKEYLKIEHPTTIHLMKQIKKTFDPKNILNPGKVIDY